MFIIKWGVAFVGPTPDGGFGRWRKLIARKTRVWGTTYHGLRILFRLTSFSTKIGQLYAKECHSVSQQNSIERTETLAASMPNNPDPFAV